MTADQVTALPTISVITPSYNQAEFLPRCLASVASQTYAPLEHLVYDPGSTDGSRELAAAAEAVELIAEPDNGQADAVGRGCRRATGDIIAWINSDDWYANPEVFDRVARRFAAPDRPDIVYGRGSYESPEGEVLGQAHIFDEPDRMATRLTGGVGVLQPATFVRREAMNEVGGPDTSLHYAMDYDLWIRLATAGKSWGFIDAPLAVALIHSDAKTEDGSGGSVREAIASVHKHFGYVPWTWAVAEAEVELVGASGVIRPELDTDKAAPVLRRAQQIFDGYNRNLPAISRLLRPPWDRPSLGTLSHLVRRIRP